MNPKLLCQLIIRPVLAHLDWPQPRERELLLCVIAMQESGLKHRVQMSSGPARSWWQIEPKTCVDCLSRCKPVDDFWLHTLELGDIRDALQYCDLAACAVAAGILRLHPGNLPEVGLREAAFQYYLASWRPAGWEHPSEAMGNRWYEAYTQALAAHKAHYEQPR